MVLETIKTFYERNEKKVGIIALLCGFVVDSLTLRGVDQLIENLIIVFYLLLAGLGIIFLQRLEMKLPVEAERGRIHFWTFFFTQFALGGLFSAFFVFYFRSSSFEVSFPFLLLLLVGLVAGEVFKKKSTSLVFQCGIFFFAIFSFLIFLIPTVFRNISIWTFLLSSVLALALLWGFLYLLKKTIKERYREKKNKIALVSAVIFVFVQFFYFTGLIPPLPLVAKDIDVYHFVRRTDQGNYVLSSEKEGFWEKISLRDTMHVSGGSPVYVWSAIYSPISLNTTIVHVWQRFDSAKSRWIEMGKINIPIQGGREKGYRTYSYFPGPSEGIWRVDVESRSGQIMGRIKFNVKEGDRLPELVEEIK